MKKEIKPITSTPIEKSLETTPVNALIIDKFLGIKDNKLVSILTLALPNNEKINFMFNGFWDGIFSMTNTADWEQVIGKTIRYKLDKKGRPIIGHPIDEFWLSYDAPKQEA